MEVIIGIDISKRTTDWCVLCGSEKPKLFKTGNSDGDLSAAIEKIVATYRIEKGSLLLCAEYTNIYWYPLARVCERMGVPLWMENAYNISLQTKRKREKSDSADAYQIAMYAKRFGDEVCLFQARSKKIMRLKQLVKLQEECDRLAGKYKGRIKDVQGFFEGDLFDDSYCVWCDIRDTAIRKSKDIEQEIETLIASDNELKRQDELLRSIPGVGLKTSHMMIAKTAGFTAYTNARKFCCQAGVATFRRTSGTSIDSGDHVSGRCDHQAKRYIHLASRSAATICKEGVLKDYYERKLREGKSKMSALNAVSAKLITIMFAVIRDNCPFDPSHKYEVKKV